MSEIINNSRKRVDELKKLILNLHNGVTPEETQKQLTELMGSVPYGEVVQAEEELIQEGLKQEEVLKFCDIHTEALKGKIDVSYAKDVPQGHPVDIFIAENREVQKVVDKVKHLLAGIERNSNLEENVDNLKEIHSQFNSLMDLEKHYVRKENLIFPYLEKNDITGPPMVMWGKHDEIRSFLKSSLEILTTVNNATVEQVKGFAELVFNPTLTAIGEMIYKEEQILFPMCMDTLTEIEWYQIYKQSSEIGYCLYSPEVEWVPENVSSEEVAVPDNARIKLSTGSFKLEELEALFGCLPVDLTFVDADNKVRYFSHGKDRIFERNKAILGRLVQHCHPPSSVHIVDKIVNDFKSGAQDEATFWIKMGEKYVHIAYYAARDEKGNYLGTLEVTQNIQPFKDIEGERRLLTYDN